MRLPNLGLVWVHYGVAAGEGARGAKNRAERRERRGHFEKEPGRGDSKSKGPGAGVSLEQKGRCFCHEVSEVGSAGEAPSAAGATPPGRWSSDSAWSCVCVSVVCKHV